MAVPRLADEVIDELLAETERRYLEFTKLTLGLSTGTLSLLLPFKQQYVRPQLGFRWLVLVPGQHDKYPTMRPLKESLSFVSQAQGRCA
jgi:hypothetical protein